MIGYANLYKPGDKVKVAYNLSQIKQRDLPYGQRMVEKAGETMTIKRVIFNSRYGNYYSVEENPYAWQDHMLEENTAKVDFNSMNKILD